MRVEASSAGGELGWLWSLGWEELMVGRMEHPAPASGSRSFPDRKTGMQGDPSTASPSAPLPRPQR